MRWFTVGWTTFALVTCSVFVEPAQNLNGVVPVAEAAEPSEQFAAHCGVALDVRNTRSKAGLSCPDSALLSALASWVSARLELPEVRELPAVKFASQEQLVLIRLGSSRPNLRSRYRSMERSAFPPTHGQHEIVALYEDATKTIYLPEGWTGATPAEISILVHEIVHHVENLAGLKYECAAAREKRAFAAQEHWLRMFGSSLADSFRIDPFTLLVRTSCAH